MTGGTVGVLGGTGAVGRAAVRVLAAAGIGPLRIGGRDEATATAAARRVGGEGRAVDATDPGGLAEFVRGCTLVVHCAGPSHRLSPAVAAAADAADVDLVDAGGAAAGPRPGAGRVRVSFAGALPGLSGLLPRLLAREFDRVHELTVHAAVRDRFTAAGAEDYLVGVLAPDTVPAARWEAGRVVPDRAPGLRVCLPYLGEGRASAFVDDEGRAVAAELGLAHGRWCSVSRTDALAAAVTRSRGRDLRAAAQELRVASSVDLGGSDPLVVLVAAARGPRGGRRERVAVAHAAGIAEMTGAMAAAAAREVLAGAVRPGAWRAADALDPVRAVAALRESGTVEVDVRDGTLDDVAAHAEGAL